MKETEKERRYNEALERARKLQETCDNTAVIGWCEYIFPELKECEDEKIRKTLIKFFSKGAENNSSTNGISDKDIISWLEKQGERKETLCDKCRKEQPSGSCQDITALGRCALEYQGEQKPIDKVEPIFNIGDTMRTLQEASKGITNGLPVIASIDDEYYHCTNELIAIKDQDSYEYPAMNRRQNPAWSEEDEAYRVDILVKLEPHITDDNFTDVQNWFKSLKNRVQPQPKQEWSEEDKVKINRIVAFLENLNLKNLNIIDDNNILKKDIEWLKTLRPQSTWKPSKE